jgi:RING finger/CHY zinc finger protein 1
MGNSCNKIESDDIILSGERVYRSHGKTHKLVTKAECGHPLKKYMYVCGICKKIYDCRYCHDQNEYHKIYGYSDILCLYCKKIGSWGTRCSHCSKSMGSYVCYKCQIITDEDRFHCNKCGYCYIGKRDNTFHCNGCNKCLNIKLLESHKCRSREEDEDCYFCLESVTNTKKETVSFSECTHTVHKECFKEYVKNTNRNKLECGICRRKINYKE